MPTAHETPRDLRKKLSRATASHKSLKDKYRQKQYELKKLNNCLSAMQTSRDKWRLHSKENKISVDKLKQELCNMTKERDEFKTQIANIELLDLKKTILLI
jgi:predicted RNase H-like nuclease (RuvC/YqgF family)